MFQEMYNDADNQQDEAKIRLAVDQKILTGDFQFNKKEAPKNSVN